MEQMSNKNISFDFLIKEISSAKNHLDFLENEIIKYTTIIEAYNKLLWDNDISLVSQKKEVENSDIVFNTIVSIGSFVKLNHICEVSGLSVNIVRNALYKLKSQNKVSVYRPTQALKSTVYGLFEWVDREGNLVEEHKGKYKINKQ